ncbi:hypothetical protein BC826DRAFT_1050773 [Russula brevipes]|nr:hypothetical protein BC826DRAFT_1050773 [Russula brevipes]
MWELIVRMLCWMARWTGGCRIQDKRTGQSFLGSRAPLLALLLVVVDAFPPFFCPLVSIACIYTGPHDPISLNSVNCFPTRLEPVNPLASGNQASPRHQLWGRVTLLGG